MTLTDELIELPDEHTRSAIEDIIKAEKLHDYKVSVTKATGKGENFLGIIDRVKVSGTDEKGKQKEINLIVKVPLDSQMLREKFSITLLYNREIRAYEVNLPKLSEFQDKFNISQNEKFKYTKCYKTNGSYMKEFLILDDLKEKHFEMADRKKSMDLNHLKLTVVTLANFHALSFAMKKVNPELFAELTENLENPLILNSDSSNFYDVVSERAIGVLEDATCIEKLKVFSEDLGNKLDYFVSPSTAEPYNIICHGDCWINNLLFKYEGLKPIDIMMLDWQVMRYTSPIIDLAFLFFTSTDENIRREHFHDMIEFYYMSLTARLALMDVKCEDVFPEVIFREHLKLLLPYGLGMSLIILPSIMSEEDDVVDMDALLKKDKIDLSDIQLENEKSSSRYEVRMRGIVRDFVRLNLI